MWGITGDRDIIFKQGCNYGNEWIFCGTGTIPWFWTNQETGIALDDMYKRKRKIGCGIKIVFQEK